jgi:hypothetical protein
VIVARSGLHALPRSGILTSIRRVPLLVCLVLCFERVVHALDEQRDVDLLASRDAVRAGGCGPAPEGYVDQRDQVGDGVNVGVSVAVSANVPVGVASGVGRLYLAMLFTVAPGIHPPVAQVSVKKPPT